MEVVLIFNKFIDLQNVYYLNPLSLKNFMIS